MSSYLNIYSVMLYIMSCEVRENRSNAYITKIARPIDHSTQVNITVLNNVETRDVRDGAVFHLPFDGSP